MNLSPIKLGLVFTGWGIMVALFAVFGAPRLQATFGIAKTMYANLAAFAVVVLVIAIWTTDRTVLIVAVIVSGIFIGVNNTITTQAVMTVSPVEKPVASAAYSFVRFIGGGLAPYAAGRLVIAFNIHVPFFIGAGAIVLGIVILSTARRLLTEAAARLAAALCTSCTPRKTPSRVTRAPTARTWRRHGRWSGTTWTSWRLIMSPPRGRSCCTRPITAPPGGWWPNTRTRSGPAQS
jgi:ACDE family multidrug resistance protein